MAAGALLLRRALVRYIRIVITPPNGPATARGKLEVCRCFTVLRKDRFTDFRLLERRDVIEVENDSIVCLCQ
jgi:hypothetical protein